MRTFWVVVDHLMLPAILMGILAPLVGPFLGLRAARRRNPSSTAAVRGALLGLCIGGVLFLGVIWAMFAVPPPGRGVQAEAGYRRAEPVIAALERYREDRGAYPDALAALSPYLADASLVRPRDYQDDERLEYQRLGDAYEMAFEYHQSGINVCRYTPAGGWNCSGYI